MEETVLLGVQRIQTSEQSSIILHSVRAADLVNHLIPELRLLDSHSKPYSVRKTVVNYLCAGQQLTRERWVVLPLLPESLCLLGEMAIAAGETIEEKEVITHSRLCEEAGRLLKDEVVWEDINIIGSVAPPVYRRPVKEQRTHIASLLQALLRILA